jgi:hypothetical protein
MILYTIGVKRDKGSGFGPFGCGPTYLSIEPLKVAVDSMDMNTFEWTYTGKEPYPPFFMLKPKAEAFLRKLQHDKHGHHQNPHLGLVEIDLRPIV